MEKKTHWKKAFNSDYLSSSDVDGKDLNLTIKHVRYQECMTQSGKKYCNVAHFENKGYKPMILNVVNSKTVKSLAGGAKHLEEWNNIPVQVYVDPNVKFAGELVEGLRIRNVKRTAKQELTPKHPSWDKAISYLKKEGTISRIKENWTLSKENEELLKNSVI